MKPNRIWLAALLAVATAWGCAAESDDEPADPSAGKGDEGAGGPKGDCHDDDSCHDADGDTALVQLGLDDFYDVGDEWTVAWVYRNEDAIHHDEVQQLGGATFQAPRLVHYEVVEVGEARFGSVTRPTATVAVTGDAPDAPDAIQAQVAPPLSHRDVRIDYTVNELFNPVSKTFYGLDDFGRTVERTVDLDGRSNLTMQFDSLPNGYPNIDRIRPRSSCDDDFFQKLHEPEGRDYTACWDRPRDLPEQVADVADAAGVDTRSTGLHIGATDAQPDYMFWQPGNLHPTFVSGPRGMGVLVSQVDR
ncbi:MAG: hypothetical protein ACOCUS_06030 [Polyangiales bacterium]